jgi:DNA modification methylase
MATEDITLKVKDKYGFLPTSVWHLGKDPTLDLFVKDDSAARTCKRGEGSFLPNYKLSRFNPKLASRAIGYWSNPNDLIFDPFAGRATRGFVANSLKRNYLGIEISEVTFANVKEAYGELVGCQKSFGFEPRCNLTLIKGDGCERCEELSDESVDLVFTCPPYWNIERYESCEGQLSDCKTYKEFLSRISSCLKECYRVLKPEHFSVWVVSDFRRGHFYCLHKDIIDLHLQNGFELHDIVISVLNSPFVSFKAAFNDREKYTGKTHEYILVFKKPR